MGGSTYAAANGGDGGGDGGHELSTHVSADGLTPRMVDVGRKVLVER